MPEPQHTPEPWQEGIGLEVIGPDGVPILTVHAGSPRAQADLKRVVDCVNALRGVDEEGLAQLPPPAAGDYVILSPSPTVGLRLKLCYEALHGVPTDYLEKLEPGWLAELIEQAIHCARPKEDHK